MIANSVSIFVQSQFPDFVNQDGPLLVTFVKYYYEWMEQFENPVYVTRKLQEYGDVDAIPDKFLSFLRNEFMVNMPHTVTDERSLLKNILNFYRAKGTEKAYRLLFRILFAENDISFYYPGNDILRASDGNWVVERSMKLKELHIAPADLEAVINLKGMTSGATARQDYALIYLSEAKQTVEIFITHLFDTFIDGEMLLDADTGETIGQLDGAVTVHPGRYVGTDGFLSSDKYLQDNFYYQEFSYQVNSGRSLSDYADTAKLYTHPAGTKLFGGVSISTSIDVSAFLGLSLLDSSKSVFDDVTISITYEISVIGEAENYGTSLTVYIDREKTGDTIDIVEMSLLKDWLDTTPFNKRLTDVAFMETHKFRWMKDSASPYSFTFPDWSGLRLDDTVNSATVYDYADYVVNTSIVLLKNEYPYGATSGISYKYYRLTDDGSFGLAFNTAYDK